jgi:hypothetical protein
MYRFDVLHEERYATFDKVIFFRKTENCEMVTGEIILFNGDT